MMKIIGDSTLERCVIGKTVDGTLIKEFCNLDTITTTKFSEIVEIKGFEAETEIQFFNWQTSDPKNSKHDYQIILLSEPYTGNPGSPWRIWWD